MNTLIIVASVWLLGTVGLVVWVQEGRRRERERRQVELLSLFGQAIVRAETEPRELVAWARLAAVGRTMFPEVFRMLDAAGGHAFPFSNAYIDGVHARWSAKWLAWEREHDTEYKRRVGEIEAALDGAAPDRAHGLRARIAELEQEKLQRYQERYEEYVRIGKAITGLAGGSSERP